MPRNEEIKVKISADDQASKKLKNVSDEVGGLEGRMDKFGKFLKGAAFAGAAVFAFDKIKDGIVSVVKEFGEAQQVEAQLNAVLKSTGQIAGVTKEQVLGLSQSLQKQTTFSDEAITSAQNLLLTFTKIGGQVFPDVVKTALDMSTALGQDLQSSVMQLGKALNSPVEGLAALSRVGVRFTEDQEKMIKKLVEAGDVMGAQKVILSELATEFGGSATEKANTFLGKIDQMKNAWSDLKEVLGGAIAEVLVPHLEKLVGIMQTLPDLFASMRTGAGDFIKTVMENEVVIVIVQALKDAFDLVWQSIQEYLIPAWNEFYATIEPHIPVILEFLKYFAQFVGVVLLGAFIVVTQALSGLLAVLAVIIGKFLEWSTWWSNVGSKAWEGLIKAAQFVADVFDRIIGLIDSMVSKLQKLQSFTNIGKGLTGIVSSVGGAITAPLDKIMGNKQFGGYVGARQSYLVGENGPEVFTPTVSGRIGKGGGGITINISGNTLLDEDAGRKIGDQIIHALKMNMKI